MKTFFYLFSGLFLLIFASCNEATSQKRQPSKIYGKFRCATIHEQSIKLSELKKSRHIRRYELTSISGSPTLVMVDIFSNLFFLDLQAKKIIHRITIPYSYVSAFHVFSQDSILVEVSNVNFTDGNVDSTLFLMDYNGNIYKYLLLQDSLLYCSLHRNKEQKNLYFPLGRGNNFLFLDSNKIFLPLKATEEDSFPPKLAYYDIRKEKLVISKFPWNPLPKQVNCFYPSHTGYYDIVYANKVNNHHNPVFMVGYRPIVYEWDVVHDTVWAHRINPYMTDTVLPVPVAGTNINYTNALYNTLNYNPYTQQYYVEILFSPAYHRVREIVVLNKDFQKTADLMNPSSLSTFFIPLKDSMFSVSLSRRDKSLHLYSCISPEFYTIADSAAMRRSLESAYNPDIDEYQQLLKACDISPSDIGMTTIDYKLFIDKILPTPIPDSFVVFSVHIQSGCLSCAQEILSFIGSNRQFFEMTPNWYGIIFSDDEKLAKEMLEAKNIGNLPHIIITPATPNNKYFIKGKNPRLTIVKNGKIIFDKIYEYDDPAKIQDKVFEFYHLDDDE